jgi:hypothetical protein
VLSVFPHHLLHQTPLRSAIASTTGSFFRALALGLIEDIVLLIFVSFVIKTMIHEQDFNLPLSALPWKMTTND